MLFVSLSESGRSLSFAIANKNLEAASRPDKAPDIIVSTARRASAIPTLVEATASKNAKIGSSLGAPSLSHHSPSTDAIIIIDTIT